MFKRIRRPALYPKITHPSKIIPMLQDGMYMGWSGFTGVGYPKVTPVLLADHVEKNNLQGKLRFNLFVGASTGAETEDRWAKLDMIARRYPHQVGKNIAKGINSGRISFADKHLSEFPVDLVYGYYALDRPKNKLDVAIVEATAITEEGHIVPGASVGATPEIIQQASKVIVEVNTAIPSFEGLHDLTFSDIPPNRKPLLITRVDDRIGNTAVPIDPDKIIAIIESDKLDNTTEAVPEGEDSEAISNHILDFLQNEVKQGRLPKNLLPLQSGIGNIANAIIGGLAQGTFRGVTVWTEVIQDTFLDFFDQGKCDFATATSIRFSPSTFKRFYSKWDQYTHKLLLRSQSVSNSPEVIRRLGVIAMNTPVEFDIYGHANSTMVHGSRILNGLGGSGDFLRNAKLSIMHAPSTRPSKTDPIGISSVVPFCTHVDHTEHDLDILVTEQGLADLRGLAPKERAKVIIEKCAHPAYKPILQDYLKRSTDECLKKGMGHEPHMLERVFKMHLNLVQNGTMRISSWD
uniref:Acetyl-CoA hydrolase n=1 Tax=Arcella intermedia TaxID=1963864 RepID=A0A6B2L215_9EUKA